MSQNQFEQPAQGGIQGGAQESWHSSAEKQKPQGPEQPKFEAKKTKTSPKKTSKAGKKGKAPKSKTKPKKQQVTDEEAANDNPYIRMVFNSAFVNKAQSKILAPGEANRVEQALLYRATAMKQQAD